MDSDQQNSGVEDKLVAQLEHYFSDANLRWDRFMRETLEKEDQAIPISVIMKFNRVKNLLKELQTSEKEDGGSQEEAKGEDSGLESLFLPVLKTKLGAELAEKLCFKVDFENKKLCRKTPFVDSDLWYYNTIVVKFEKAYKFPQDFAGSLEELKLAFEKVAKVALVRQRKYLTKDAKTRPKATKVLGNADLLGTTKYQIFWLPKYVKDKLENNEFVAEDIRKQNETYPTFEQLVGKRRKSSKRSSNSSDQASANGRSSKTAKTTIKEAFNQFGPVRFVKTNINSQNDGIVFFKQNIADKVLAEISKLDKAITIDDGNLKNKLVISPFILSSEQESLYLKK
ncbi:hypothetical protein BB560_005480 [Smittium megazygosporum]|uniref:HTH La-type RNA-binding domain-containing protein n=1 Tax=Smittium megazygosporum TaxID=133381 RepID=A0A2T9Z4Q1_9FUNG|nr:hypothetical protein BB560_005480 [Smittium megazygosporum]